MDTTDNKAFENGYASGKIDGFNEGWTLARKIMCDYSDRDLGQMFGTISYYDIFRFPVEDVRRSFEEFEAKIKVDDVIKYGNYVGVVLQINGKIVRTLTTTSCGHITVSAFPISNVVKIAEGVDSFSDVLENVGYKNGK